MRYDVVVVGGGMVGANAALMFASVGYRVAVIEPLQAKEPSNSDQYDFRGLALSQISLNILKNYSIYPHIKYALAPIDHVHVSEQGTFGAFKWSAAQEELNELGAVVEAGLLTCILQQQLVADSRISCLWGDELESFSYNSEQQLWDVKLRKAEIQSSLLLGADGINSCVRKGLGIQSIAEDLNQVAIVANIKCTRNHKNTAYERFFDKGSLALVPYKNNTMKSIIIVSKKDEQELFGKSKGAYLNLVNTLASSHIGSISECSDYHRYPVVLRTVQSLSTGRAVLLGNAAITVHPIAAQGFNLALRDIAVLISLIGPDMKDIDQKLQNYSQTRLDDYSKIIRSTKIINELFQDKSQGKQILKSGCMTLVQLNSFIKRNLMEYMLGTAEVLPKEAFLEI